MAVPSHENRPRPRFRSSLTDRLLPGVRRVIRPGGPAAGADWGPIGPTGGRVWRVLGGLGFLTTSAAVANRTPGILLTDGNENVLRSFAPASIAAGVTSRVGFWLGQEVPGPAGSGLFPQVPLPSFWIPEGWNLSSSTDQLQAADQWSPPFLIVEELYEAWQDITLHELAEEEEALAAAGLLAHSQLPRG